MILETFDQEKHDEAMKRDWYEVGRADGEKIGLEKGQALERENSICRLISFLRKQAVPEENIKSTLQDVYGLSAEETGEYLEK